MFAPTNSNQPYFPPNSKLILTGAECNYLNQSVLGVWNNKLKKSTRRYFRRVLLRKHPWRFYGTVALLYLHSRHQKHEVRSTFAGFAFSLSIEVIKDLHAINFIFFVLHRPDIKWLLTLEEQTPERESLKKLRIRRQKSSLWELEDWTHFDARFLALSVIMLFIIPKFLCSYVTNLSDSGNYAFKALNMLLSGV